MLIQLGILVVLALTLLCQVDFNRRLLIFNKNTIRPWVYSDLDTSFAYPVEIAKDGKIRFNHTIINTGKTPAFYVKTYTLLGAGKEFPEHRFKRMMDADTNPRSLFVFPNQEIYGVSNYMECGIEDYHITPGGTLLVRSEPMTTRQEVIDVLDTVGLHAFVYHRYFDADGTPYGLRTTFFVDFVSEPGETTYTVKFFQTYNSDKLIK